MSLTPEPRSESAAPSAEHGGDRATTSLDLRILRSLRRIIQSVDIHSRKLATMHKITAPQLVTLLSVVEAGSSTASDIAKQIHLSNSTVVGILDRLEAKGLVRRERSTLDRRLVHVCATEAGAQLIRTAPCPLQDGLARALHALPELEQTAIALSLERIVDLMAARDLTALPLLDSGEVTDADETAPFSE